MDWDFIFAYTFHIDFWAFWNSIHFTDFYFKFWVIFLYLADSISFIFLRSSPISNYPDIMEISLMISILSNGRIMQLIFRLYSIKVGQFCPSTLYFTVLI